MFGLRSFFGRSSDSSNTTTSSSDVQSSEPIFVSDYIGTAADTSEPGTVPGSDTVVYNNPVSAVNDFGFYAARPDRSVITLSTLTNFSTKKTKSEKLLNHKIAGCDGEFPVTNPVKNNIYYYETDNKYYICKNGSTGTVAKPDEVNFEYISLKNASGGNAVKGIRLTGSATGTGAYSDDTGIYTIATDVQYANVKGTPTSLKNPNKLTISLNGTATEYDGSSVKTVSITPTSIGAQPAGNYSVVGHTHTVTNITDMPKSMPNPYGLTLRLNGVAQTAYTGSKAVDINITPAGIGAQPAGSYAAAIHNHDTQYNTKSEITTLLAGKLGKSENAVSASKLATARTISLTGAVTGSVGFDGSGNAAISTTLAGFDASKIVSGVISADRIPKTAFSEFVPVKDKAARLALTKQEVQNGDTVKETDSKKMYLVIDDTKLSSEEGYQDYTTVVDWNTIIGRPSTFTPSTHTHTWSQISDRPSTMANPNALTISLNGKAQTAYTGASAVAFNITPASIGAQVAGSYAAASHNHSGVYAPVSHTHNGNQITALTGYVKAESASAIAVTDSLIVALGKLEKALDGKQNTGSYAPSSHNHSSANITSLSGYTKATTVTAISTSDTLNVALGKLEKALDGKQAAGSYALVSHNHDTVYAKASHTHLWAHITDKPSTFTPSSHTHTWANITDRPSTMANPHALTISLNGKAQTAYSGSAAVAFDITPASIGAQVAGSYALSSHNHSGVYAPMTHSHTIGQIGALAGYAKAVSVSAITTSDTILTAIGKLEKALDSKQASGNYSIVGHKHDDLYQPKGSYASSGHNHDSVYSKLDHAHAWGEITGKPGTFTPSAHNQAANTITAMTGYAKPTTTSAILVGDTLNAAIGKLEKALDGKQAAGSYAAANHNHDTAYAAKSHNHAGVYQPVGNYAAASHTHTTAQVSGLDAKLNNIFIGATSRVSTDLASQAFTGDLKSGFYRFDGDAVGLSGGTAMIRASHPSENYAFSLMSPYGTNNVYFSSQVDGKNPIKLANQSDVDAKLAKGNYSGTAADLKGLIDGKAPVSHTHDDRYFTETEINNKLAGYQPKGSYAAASHTHTIGQIGALAGYAKAASVSAVTTSDTILTAIGKLEKALDGKQASGSYASASHNHDSVYSKLEHAHAWGEITGKPSTFAPSGHNQASNTINIMTGYSKPSATSAISTADSLNTAIGKLEKALDGKQAAGSYALASHNHSGVYAPVSHTHTATQVTQDTSHRFVTDTEKSGWNSKAAGNHNHNGVYAPASHNHTLANISIGESYTAGYVNGLMAPFVPSARGNKLFGISPKDVVVEYSKDGGKTWLDYGASDTQKAGLFNELGDASITIGKATTKELNVAQGTNSRLRITISAKSLSRYVSINKTYMWFSSSGNTCKCSCKVLKGNNNADNWTTIWDDKSVAGWSGGNFYNHTQYSFQGSTASADTNCLKVRYEFWMTELNTNYPAGSIYYITGYGDNAWSDGNVPFVRNDHLYKWDSAYNMLLPAGLEAKGEIKGVVTKAKQDEQGNVIHTTYSKTTHSHSWGEISGRPSTMPNPNGLTISLNGKAQTAYTGASAVAFNITPASIGAQVAGSYAAASHSHSWDTITSKPSTFTPSAHNQASSTITAMTGYAKAASVAAIAATDSLNVAIGKLEKALDSKQAAGSYALSSHNHSGVYQPAGSYAAASHTHSGVYAPVSHGNHVPATQTANNKIFLRCDNTWHTITPAEIGAQPAGSYAASNHNHNGVYVTTEDSWRFAPKSIGNSSTNTDLNNIVAQGYYVSTSSSNKFTNTPDNLMAFELFVTGIGYDNDSSYKTQLIKDISNNRYYVRTQTNWTAPVSWTTWSQIAITSDLNSKLSTSGGTISGALTVTGQILSNADVVAYSDKRVKTNVVKIDDALNKVDQISGYTYDMQGLDFKGKRQAGVIAQELLEVLPEAVVQDDNGMYAVRYTNIIPLLIEAIKEEKSKIESLEEKNRNLEERLAKIEKMLENK